MYLHSETANSLAKSRTITYAVKLQIHVSFVFKCLRINLLEQRTSSKCGFRDVGVH